MRNERDSVNRRIGAAMKGAGVASDGVRTAGNLHYRQALPSGRNAAPAPIAPARYSHMDRARSARQIELTVLRSTGEPAVEIWVG